MSRIVLIKHERLLVNLFYYLLSKGITKPVTEKQYFSIVNETLEKINQNKSNLVPAIYRVEDESFEYIVAKANGLVGWTRNGIDIYKYRGYFAARATYYFSKPSVWPNVDWYTKQQDIFHSVIDSKIHQSISRKVQMQSVSEVELNLAKKIAAVFVNDIIKKYVDRAVENKRWPSQCKDVDEYIFKRNIASYIDEQGTAEIFSKLYNHAVQVVCKLIIQNKGSFQISNADFNMLAFANFLGFFDLEELKFLVSLKHIHDKKHDLYIRCTVANGEARCFFLKCTCVDSFDGDNSYKRSEEEISENEVRIMEKRLSYLKV